MHCSSCKKLVPPEQTLFSGSGALICLDCAAEESARETQEAAQKEAAAGRAVQGGFRRLKGALIAVVGIVAFIGAARVGWLAYNVGSEGTAATATVVGLQYHPGRRRRPAHTEAFVTVELNGRQHECSFDDETLGVGSRVPIEVAFVDGRIHCERQGTNWKNWSLAGGLACCLGPLALLIGLGMLFGDRRRNAS